MATFNELANQYAKRILSAISQDGYSKYTKITTASLSVSKTIQELKSVKIEIDGLVYSESRNPLSDSDKTRIIAEIQKELHLPTQQRMESLFEAASNDDLSDLTDEIENILKGR